MPDNTTTNLAPQGTAPDRVDPSGPDPVDPSEPDRVDPSEEEKR